MRRPHLSRDALVRRSETSGEWSTGAIVALGLLALGIGALLTQIPEIRRELRIMRM